MAKCFSRAAIFNSYNPGKEVLTPVLQMRKIRLRRGHTFTKLVEYNSQTYTGLRSKSTELLCKEEANEQGRVVCFFGVQQFPHYVRDKEQSNVLRVAQISTGK